MLSLAWHMLAVKPTARSFANRRREKSVSMIKFMKCPFDFRESRTSALRMFGVGWYTGEQHRGYPFRASNSHIEFRSACSPHNPSFPCFSPVAFEMIRLFAAACTILLLRFSFLVADDTTVKSDAETVAHDPWSRIPTGISPSLVIDLAIETGWRERGIKPVSLTSDRVFVRRVYLDLIGRIPDAQETSRFLQSSTSNKREQLIDMLLTSEEHAVHFSELWDAMLIGRTEIEPLRKRTTAGWMQYLQNAVRENRPWNELVQEMVLARPSSPEIKGSAWYLYARNSKSQDIAESVAKDFFGVRIDCAQCHDHPLASEIEQKHYWGLVAFFNRSKNVDTPNGPAISESAIGGFSDFSNLQGKSSPNELVFLGERRVEETRPSKDTKEEERDDLYRTVGSDAVRVPKFSRREQFVDKVLKDHPLLATAAVNRLWAWMMGRGLVHPVDTLDSYHPASHPGLLEWLAKDFRESGYDSRRLLKNIAMSRAYQLSSDRPEFVDPQWFANAMAKPLTAEMLQRSFVVALVPDSPQEWSTPETRVAVGKLFPDVLVEESVAHVGQALHLTNSSMVHQLVSVRRSIFLRGLRSDYEHSKNVADSLIRPLFSHILGRDPSSDELSHCQSYIVNRLDRVDQAIEGVAWSLLTSAEFRFNH